MTFYKNLGPITFEYETQQLEVFSGSDSTVIFQFKNYSDVDVDHLASLMGVYGFIFRDEHLLQLYVEKNKPVSILLHKVTPVSFQHISIQYFCQIIKQMATTIFQTRKMSPSKIGQITKQMFFQIDGQLRYLYFPVQDCAYHEQEIVTEIVEFFNSLKEEKQVSHRLLLKKISKCITLQSVIEETDYFINIYHSKQSAITKKSQATTSQQTFFTKTIKNPYFNQTNVNNQNRKIKNFNPFGLNNEVSSGKNTSRRKYKLFKDTENKSFRNTNYSSQFNLSTWRNNDTQILDKNATLRSNSKAIHLDMTQRSTKKQSSSLFQRANSYVQSPQRFSNRKLLMNSTHTHYQNYVQPRNEQIGRPKSHQNSKYQQKQISSVCQQSSRLKQSIISKNVSEQLASSKQMNSSQNLENKSSSSLMKQMVNNSLKKWRQKSKQKVNIFSRIKHQDKQKSTIADSRSKLIQRGQNHIFQDMKDSLSNQDLCSFHKISGQNLTQSTKLTNFNKIQSQNKLKKGSYNNRSTYVETTKNEIQKSNILTRNSQEFQFQYNPNFNEQKINRPIVVVDQNFQESLQQIRLGQSSIEQITIKNKLQQSRLNRKQQTKKISIKDIPQKKNNQKDILQQKKIQKQKPSKSLKKNSKQSKDENILKKDPIGHQFSGKLKYIILAKQQIDFIGIAVVQTAENLKSFESIFWQLPMFFLYKKFYQKRLQLSKSLNQLSKSITSQKSKEKVLQQILKQVLKNKQQVSEQNESIEQSLKKLLKTVKKKMKKQYPRKQEQQYVEKHLHLNFSIQYDSIADQFISMYLQSLLEAKMEFPELVFHIIDIFEAISVCKGQNIDKNQKESFDSSDKKVQNIQRAEKYFNTLLKKKQIKAIARPEQKKVKGKK